MSGGFETLRIETDGRGVARLTLARGAKHNAMSARMIAELTEAAGRLGEDPAVRLVLLAAEGPSFSAGADLGWMRAQFEAPRAQRMDEALALARMLRALNALPKPLLGRVHGPAFGGGLGLVATCDLAVGADAARFAFTEVALGLIPATISPFVLARIGEGAARRLFLTGRSFEAAEAARLGLLARAVPADALDAAIEEEVAALLRADPAAQARAKALARSLGPPIDDAVLERTAALLADCWESPEARRRIARFLEKSERVTEETSPA